MHLNLSLLLLHLLSTYLSSTAATATVTVTAPAPCFTPTGPEYYLKTQVIKGGNSSKSGLYLEAYHTGAGENDAVLVPNTPDQTLAKGFLNGSYQVTVTYFAASLAAATLGRRRLTPKLLAIRSRLLLPLEHDNGDGHQRCRF